LPLLAITTSQGQEPSPDILLDQFLDFAASKSLELYSHQEEAFLEILEGNHVILNTPTGTGKSLVATGAHFAALAQGKRSFYTAPTKALVSEKFLALREDFSETQVGMITGDTAINPHAPIIACTAEILAYLALREGADCDAEVVIMDEFHYYSDTERGWAWQIPLLQLPRAQFLLMSATLGDMTFFENDLTERTGRSCALITGTTRAVPLSFQYRETPLHQSIETVLEQDLAPVYVVYFTQKQAFAAAQAFASIGVLSASERAKARDIIQDFPFDTPVGKDLKRLVGLGIGVHHGGLLPKYRLMMEQLASWGVLKIICGTDTLGVGINVPIRTVLFSQLCRFDGSKTRIVTAREFHQIAGRAGRRGFDTQGHVWVQAPAHWIENQQAEKKAVAGAKSKRAAKKKPPERNYVHWNIDTYQRLIQAEPEPLFSNFGINHQMLISTLSRPGDNCAAVNQLLRDNHEPRSRQRKHIRRAVSLYRSLKQAGLVEEVALGQASPAHTEPHPKPLKAVRVSPELQDNFALHQPLSLFALEALWVLKPETHGEVLSVLEAVLENPMPILWAQENLRRKTALEEMKAQGLDYEARQEKLEQITHPKPLADFLFPAFEIFKQQHPWVGTDQPQPKSVARELFETQLGFSDYVRLYDLKRSEGLLLRYLVDVYKSLQQNIPVDLELNLEGEDISADADSTSGGGASSDSTSSIDILCQWLHDLIQTVDSDVLADLESLVLGAADSKADSTATPELSFAQVQRVVRQEMFRWVEALARRDYQAIPAPLGAMAAEKALTPYWEEHDSIIIDASARNLQFFSLETPHETDWQSLAATQTISDPQGWQEWELEAEISRNGGEISVACVAIYNKGDL